MAFTNLYNNKKMDFTKQNERIMFKAEIFKASRKRGAKTNMLNNYL